jgi:hypothetical protein
MPPGRHPALLGGPFLPAAVAAFASGLAALALLATRSAPRGCARWPGPAFADGRFGVRARRVVPMVSVRRWPRWCAAPLRRRVAPWRSPACGRAPSGGPVLCADPAPLSRRDGLRRNPAQRAGVLLRRVRTRRAPARPLATARRRGRLQIGRPAQGSGLAPAASALSQMP